MNTETGSCRRPRHEFTRVFGDEQLFCSNAAVSATKTASARYLRSALTGARKKNISEHAFQSPQQGLSRLLFGKAEYLNTVLFCVDVALIFQNVKLL